MTFKEKKSAGVEVGAARIILAVVSIQLMLMSYMMFFIISPLSGKVENQTERMLDLVVKVERYSDAQANLFALFNSRLLTIENTLGVSYIPYDKNYKWSGEVEK